MDGGILATAIMASILTLGALFTWWIMDVPIKPFNGNEADGKEEIECCKAIKFIPISFAS